MSPGVPPECLERYSDLLHLPDLRWSPCTIADPAAPSHIPYLSLPPPHDAYCLTPFLPTDKKTVLDVLNHPEVIGTIGLGHMDEEKAHEWLENRSGPRMSALNLPVIRLIDTLSDPMPKWIGYFHILRETFRLVYGSSEEESAKRQKRFEENRDLPKDLGNWQMTYSIHPDHGRKGVMHAAGKLVLSICPYIRERSGILSGGWLLHNPKSRNAQLKLDFRAVASRQNVYEGHGAAIAVWMGAGEVTKEQTIYKDQDDWDGEMEV